MRWMRFLHEARATLGRIEGDEIVVHEGDLFAGPQATGTRIALAALPDSAWLPPCEPGQIIGLWNNFRAAAAKNGWPAPAEPLYFLKSPGSATGHAQPIPAPPPEAGRVFYEGELAVVIGRAAHRISPAQASEHIFGYACANDVTALELLQRDPAFPQWTRAKSFPGFGAFGPWIETDFDPAAATLRTLVGGRERQASALSDMFFAPAELVSRLSQDMRLAPGDVILCGTPPGALPMRPGTTVEVVIDGIGTLRNVFGAT
jgi:2-keto-4-pentenoate hydratase/2-oxohepta-3-ene-1,7-dioic acid hydratase in catechol pathway